MKHLTARYGHIENCWPPLPLLDGEEAIEYNPDQTQLTTWYIQRAVSFIERNRDRPFFLYVPHSMPHVPLHVSQKFKGKSERGIYGDVIMEIDWSMGEILSALKRLGIDDNTLVVFASDNGPWLKYGDHGGSAGPLRERKFTTFDGGQRVPCIVRWPGEIPAGTICNEPATTMDLLPTFAALAGARLPSHPLDRRNIWPLLSAQAGAVIPHQAFYYFRGYNLEAIRSGRWKLHFPHTYQHVHEAGSGGKSGRSTTEVIGMELFDMEGDIAEVRNMAQQHPEVVGRLTAAARTFHARLMSQRRPPGRVQIDGTVGAEAMPVLATTGGQVRVT